jgi:SAM-dependent methyltransferase
VVRQADFDCFLCGGREHLLKYDYGRVGIFACRACAVMALYPQPTIGELAAVYDEQYFFNEQFHARLGDHSTLYGYYDYLAERANKQHQLYVLARELYGMCPDRREAAPRLLEMGCGLGYFLDTAFDVGFDVMGVEFNPAAADHVRRKYRFPIAQGSVPGIDLGDLMFDVVCAFDVIEHLHEPKASLQDIAAHTVPRGLLALVTMDSSSLVSRLLGKRLEDFRRIREHLYFFDRKTITRLLRDTGFEVLTIRSIGHTFELEQLMNRLDLIVPHLFKAVKRLIRPKWLLRANVYLDPGTKMLVIARRTV